MFKKYMIIPVILAVLGAAFAVVCFLVYISRGKYIFIRQKLKIGALILSLTAFSCSCQSNQDDIVLCYKATAPTPRITFSNELNQNQELIVDPLVNRAITGTIQEDDQSYPAYSFRIVDAKGTVLQKDELTVTETSGKQPRELCFEIAIDQDIPLGAYTLRLYYADLKNQEKNPDSYFYTAHFNLIESMILCYDMAY
ncbi:MAG: hypothetical protein JW822_07630 [Spirochaetales bacterium]|nr:hypothetical protein [Spirochaetales bacterium]